MSSPIDWANSLLTNQTDSNNLINDLEVNSTTTTSSSKSYNHPPIAFSSAFSAASRASTKRSSNNNNHNNNNLNTRSNESRRRRNDNGPESTLYPQFVENVGNLIVEGSNSNASGSSSNLNNSFTGESGHFSDYVANGIASGSNSNGIVSGEMIQNPFDLSNQFSVDMLRDTAQAVLAMNNANTINDLDVNSNNNIENNDINVNNKRPATIENDLDLLPTSTTSSSKKSKATPKPKATKRGAKGVNPVRTRKKAPVKVVKGRREHSLSPGVDDEKEDEIDMDRVKALQHRRANNSARLKERNTRKNIIDPLVPKLFSNGSNDEIEKALKRGKDPLVYILRSLTCSLN